MTSGARDPHGVDRRRRWLQLALATVGLSAALVALALAVGARNGSTSVQAAPPRGGTLRAGLLFTDGLVHYLKLPPGYDYFLDPQAGQTSIEWELLRCCLVRTLLSYNGHPWSQGGAELHPDLATSLPEISDDRLTWTFHLKRGLHYAPPLASTEMKAQDIVRAIERDLSPTPKRVQNAVGSLLGSHNFYFVDVIAGARQFAERKADSISGLQTPDDHTLVVHLLRPAGDLGYRLALPAAAPLPPSPRDHGAPFGAAQGHGAGYGRFLVASGPYMISGSEGLDFSLVPDRQKPASGYVSRRTTSGLVVAKSLTLVRNPSWDPRTDSLRKAYVDRIVFTFGGTPANSAAAIDRGAMDIVFDRNPPVDQLHRYQADPTLKSRALLWPGDYLFFLPMNLALPPFDDIHVRRAVNFAIDKAGIVGLANANPSIFIGPPYATVAKHIGFDSVENDLLHDYDPYATSGNRGSVPVARREMARSRYDRNGDGICDAPVCKRVLVVTWEDFGQRKMAALIRRDLARIGIDLRIKVKPEVYFDMGGEDPPGARIPLLLGAQSLLDFPNGSTWFVPNFYGPELSLSRGSIAITNLSLLGATSAMLARWGYPVRSVPSVDGRIEACLPLVGLAQVECWATLDQYLMERVVPWVPLFHIGYALTVSGRVRNLTWDQFTGLAALDQIALKHPR
jgi:peptide/nickel transport system substrate-binding protein